MATEATFTIPSDQFPLGSVFEKFPEMTVELERIIPAKDVVIPYFWVRGTVVADIESAFAVHPGVEQIHFVDRVEDEYLLRVEWQHNHNDVLTLLAEAEIPLIKAIGTSQEWTFEIRGDDRSDISGFQAHCESVGIPITLTKLHALTPIEGEIESALTEKQQEALALAYEYGYFDSPRAVTMQDIGDELGISEQAVASRLRRGIKQILGTTIFEESPA